MDLKHKLLVSFVAIILTVLLVFGFNAYQITKDVAIDIEKSRLNEVTQTQASLLAAEYRRIPSLNILERHLAIPQDTHDQIIFLVDKSGSVITPAALLASKVLQADVILARQVMQQHSSQKYFIHDGKLYVWADVPVAGSPYTLFRIERSLDDLQGLFVRLAGRLLVAGLILAWVAVWVALIISTAVSRRLMVQTNALQYQATHDSLTGLPNRTLLLRNLDIAIRTAAASGKSVALIMMDLNRFKEINSTLGHTFGDALLQAISERLQKAKWGSDTVARLGGDEYAMLLPMADASHSTLVTNKVLATIAEPFMINGVTLEIDASLGIAVYPDDSKDAVELISHADVAMYHAKHTGIPFTRYDVAKDPHSLARLKLASELRHAIDRGEFFLCYQPKVEIASGVILGVEALLRWRHPAHGLIPPDTFIPMAEQTGDIKTLTYWVLDNAAHQCALWNAADMPLSISINLSARVIHDDDLVTTVASALERHCINHNQLEIEITETAIMLDPSRAMEMLSRLNAMGIRLSIDDFGTGYTSMSCLKKLPVDEVKIDKSFVMNMLKDANDTVIVRSIIDLAHNMNHIVVAEGVENKKILERLSELTCDVAQGYYFSKPVPVLAFESWFKDTASKATLPTEVTKQGKRVQALGFPASFHLSRALRK